MDSVKHLVPINHVCHASDNTIYRCHSPLRFPKAKSIFNQPFPRLLLQMYLREMWRWRAGLAEGLFHITSHCQLSKTLAYVFIFNWERHQPFLQSSIPDNSVNKRGIREPSSISWKKIWSLHVANSMIHQNTDKLPEKLPKTDTIL